MTGRAVVLGAGIAGLLAAAALAESYSSVVLIERDRLPDSPVDRRGIPQGRHLHSLLSRGIATIEELVPGVLDDLVAAGAWVLDDVNMARIHMQTGRYAFNRTDAVADPAALTTYLASRPFLEFHVRRRIAGLGNVTILDGRDVSDLVVGQSGYISGVTVTERESGVTETLDAGLVVDATGRSARTTVLLEQRGYERPPRRSFTVNGVYCSQAIAIPDMDTFPERMVLVLPEGDGGRGGLVVGEDNRWLLTIAVRASQNMDLPTTFTEMIDLAADFVPVHIKPALDRAEPLSDISVYRYPGGVWHRYDRVTRHPDGLVVMGDALCCLDPINGQGITMAALHARALRTHVREGTVEPERFYRSLVPVIAPVWAANLPAHDAHGRGLRKSFERRATRWTSRKFLEAAEHDVVVTERLMRIANLIDPPTRLLEPSLVARVLAHHAYRAVTPSPSVRPLRKLG
jgi:2-polyprenyl-6-methoxyphenol hydroxylase-like FAD-dependent oxidoreductase